MNTELTKDMQFVVEIEKMKNIFRMTRVIGNGRRENDAEHSFHIALMSFLLERHSKLKVDVDRVVKMLLVHDLVEIYAGDTFAYDENAKNGQDKRERLAMDKIMASISPEMANLIESLWLEFEAKITDEARYANAMDRLQPILSNIYDGHGGTWKEHSVSYEQIIKRIEPIKDFNDEVYSFVHSQVLQAVEKGYVIANN